MAQNHCYSFFDRFANALKGVKVTSDKRFLFRAGPAFNLPLRGDRICDALKPF
jgi:hypothetical protein